MRASASVGMGLGVEGLMKREVAGPLLLWMSGEGGCVRRREGLGEGGEHTDCAHCVGHCGWVGEGICMFDTRKVMLDFGLKGSQKMVRMIYSGCA